MHYRTRRLSLLIAGAALAGLAGKAHAQYALTTDVAVPFYSGDGVTGSTVSNSTSSASAFVKYTSLSLSNLFPTSSVPNGTYTSPLTGTVSGSLVANSSAGVGTGWAYDPTYGFRLIGYYSETSAGIHSAPTMKGANSLGIIGYSNRVSAYNTSTSLMGQDAWFYNNAAGTNTTLGLTGTGFGYTYQNSIGQVFGTYQSSTPYYLNSGGQVTGTSGRYAGVSGQSGGGLGTSAWIQSPSGTPTEIGLTGLGYNYFVSGTVAGYNSSGSYTSAAPYSGTYYSEGVSGQDSSGDVIGTAQSYYNTGLGGNTAAAINSSGGTTGTYTALGQDGWFYNHASGVTTAVGLYWSTLTPTIAGSQFAALNSQLAYSNIPASSKPVGSSPSNSTYRTTSVYGISSSGQVVGTSGYYNTSSVSTNALGTDAFVYSPTTGSYTTIGLVSNGFTTIGYPQALGQTSFVNPFGVRSSTVSTMNDHNLIVGTSSVYVGAGPSVTNYTNSGQAAWIANASTGATTQIGLWNQNTTIHVCNSASQSGVGVYDDYISSMTESGFVAGYSNRYNASNGASFGSDAWVYDSSKGITFPVDPADESNGAAYTSSSIFYLSESGIAVGEYKNNSSFSAPYSAFIWSESGGFADLGSNVTLGGLSAAGYQGLIASYYSDFGGDSLYATASLPGTPTTVSAVVSLTGTAPVPEPASVAFVAVGGAVGLLRRRRRVASVV